MFDKDLDRVKQAALKIKSDLNQDPDPSEFTGKIYKARVISRSNSFVYQEDENMAQQHRGIVSDLTLAASEWYDPGSLS